MGLAYLIFYTIYYVGPLLLSLILFLILQRLLRNRTPRAALYALVAVLGASCVPWLIDRIALRADLAALEPSEIRPDAVALPPGTLWYLAEHNHAGVSCHWPCDFSTLPFVTRVADENIDYALKLGSEGQPLDRHDLWRGLVDQDIQEEGRFPYDYAFISLSGYRDYGVPADYPYAKPGWPDNVKGVHMLVVLPEDGQLDFATANIVYRRYNVQEDLAAPFFWGVVQHTEQIPSVETILADLLSVSRVAGN